MGHSDWNLQLSIGKSIKLLSLKISETKVRGGFLMCEVMGVG